jgi:hypothetical protein
MICCARNGPHQNRGKSSMIEMRRKQLNFGDGLIADEVSDLREDWMPHADEVLADEEIVAIAYEALSKRHPKSRSRGRRGAPAEMVLRLLVLKHIRNWSYQTLEREVRANLEVTQMITRVLDDHRQGRVTVDDANGYLKEFDLSAARNAAGKCIADRNTAACALDAVLAGPSQFSVSGLLMDERGRILAEATNAAYTRRRAVGFNCPCRMSAG